MKLHSFIAIAGLLLVSGCATSAGPYVTPVPPSSSLGVPGIYHRVVKGQSLWRISRLYDIDLDDLARANDISDTTKIEIGQSIFIPNRKRMISAARVGSNDEFMWPLRGRVVSTFGSLSGTMINKGIDIEPAVADHVAASRSGKVIFCSDDFENYGKTIIIDHEDGFFTVYARNNQVLVKLGDRVEKGETIARAGTAGRQKNVYLHFEIRKKHLPQNPYFYLP